MKNLNSIGGALILFLSTHLLAIDVDVTSGPYNAIPDDGLNDSTAFKSALDAVVNGGGGTLIVPPGDFTFTSKIAVDLKDKKVSISGAGKGASSITSENSSGLIWFNNSFNSNELEIFDITFLAGQKNAGTAIQINNPSMTTNGSKVSLYMQNVSIQAADVYQDFFNKGIYTGYLHKPYFEDVIVSGNYADSNASGPVTDMDVGIRIHFCHSPTLINCYSKVAKTGCEFTNLTGMLTMDRSFVVETLTGLKVTGIGSQNATANLANMHSNSMNFGLDIANLDSLDISNHTSYADGDSSSFTDVRITSSSNVDLSGVLFHTPYASTRKFLDLGGTTQSVSIKRCIFNGPGTQVVQGPNVSGVTLSQNIVNPVHQW